MIDTKKVGRPKTFDEDVALKAAVDVFWAKGYDGASMKDLTSAMGINAPSLYATYGDKEALFLNAVEHYMLSGNCTPLEVFEKETDIRKALRGFFKEVLAYSTKNEQGARGCFLSSCVSTCAETVDGVKSLLQSAVTESEARLIKRFDLAKEDGQLPSDFPSRQRARLMFDLRQGLVFRARAGIEPEIIEKDLDQWVDCVLQ